MIIERAWSNAAPQARWDALVIGAGMGGLAAAAMLANLGKRVLLLEQHGIPGGFTQSFRRRGFSWDVGLHVVGEMGRAGVPGRVLHALSGGRLVWTRIEGDYDVLELPDGSRVGIPGHLGGMRTSLLKAFPGEGAAIHRYLDLLHLAAAGMRDHFVSRAMVRARSNATDSARFVEARKLALRHTAEVLREVTGNAWLRAVLAAQWGFYGTPPGRSAFGVHALLARHYRHGAYYPRGGSMSIARSLCAAIASRGGWTRVGASIESILVEHGRVRGVRLASGEELRAPAVISAIGALNSLRLLPAEERRREWCTSIEALPSSSAHVCLNLGFRGDIRAAGASESNRWLIQDWEVDVEPWDLGATAPSMYLSFPSLKDGEPHADSLHTAELVVLAQWEAFSPFAASRWRHREADYHRLKKDISARLLKLLFLRMPALEPLLEHAELSTPLSSAHFVRAVRGAAYGLDATPERFRNPWLRPRVPVQGLYLAGSDVAVVGAVGALASGISAAVAMAPERASAWLRETVRRQQPPGQVGK